MGGKRFLSLALLTCVAVSHAPVASEPASIEIESLRARIDGQGDRADLRRFWARLKQRGSPIIQRAGAGKGKMLVTFVWQGTGAENRSPVSVFGEFNHVPWQQGDPLLNLPGTDVWYRSYSLDERITQPYLFLTEDARAHGQDVQRTYSADLTDGKPTTFQLFLDPNNHRTIENVYWGVPSRENYFLGPKADLGRTKIGADRSRLRGRITEHVMQSLTLGNSRRIWIYVPPSMGRNEVPALMVLFDGRSYIHAAQVPKMLETLIASRTIKPTIAVFVDTIDLEHRFRELCRPKENFAQFVANELRPFIERETGKAFAASDTVLAGASCGGLTASYIATQFPDRFGKVIGQSSAFWLGPESTDEHSDWLIRRIVQFPAKPVRFYLSYGNFENEDDIVLPNRRFATALRKRGYTVCLTETPGYHTFLDWRLALEPALKAQLPYRDGLASC